MGAPISQIQMPQTTQSSGGKGVISQAMDGLPQIASPTNGATTSSAGKGTAPSQVNSQMAMQQPLVDQSTQLAASQNAANNLTGFQAAAANLPDQAKAYGLRSLAGQNITFPGQGGQPQMGQANSYSNTVGSWDNAAIGNTPIQTFNPSGQTTRSTRPANSGLFGAKGKGA